MSVSSIIDPTTGKIYDSLIGQGGGINLDKGQIITATAIQEVAFPTVAPANGSVLYYDSTTDTGLRYIGNNPTTQAIIIRLNSVNQITIPATTNANVGTTIRVAAASTTALYVV